MLSKNDVCGVCWVGKEAVEKETISFTRKVDVISVLNTGHLFRVFRAHTLLNNFNLSHPNILGKYIIQ